MATRRIAMLALAFAFCSSLVWAQVNTATISGTVRDESGAVLPGANVVLTNQDTGITRTVTANAAGRYSAPALSLGNYEVRAQLDGFQTAVRSGIVLTVGRAAVVDFTLQVGAVTQTVEVTGEAPLIELTNANITGLVDDRTIRELPLNGRSYDQLALLQPGIVKYTTSGQSFNGSPGGNKFSASGSLATSNSFLLDGTDINDASNNTPGGAAGTNMGVDTIKEFKIVASTFSAEYGRASGAVISAVTRTGTNQVHGTAFEFLRNSAFDARKFRDDLDFDGDGTGDVPPFRRNQFGGTIGGPIIRDRTFFFAGYEGLREALSQSTEVRVPTPAVKQGILPLADGSGTYMVTPDHRVVPFFALYPDPHQILPFDPNDPGGLDSSVGLYFSAPNQASRQDYFMGRVDHQLTNSTNIFGRYSFDDDSRNNPDEQEAFLNTNEARRQYITLQANSVVSPTIVNSARVALNRTAQVQDAILTNSGLEGLSWVPGQVIGEIIVGEINGILFYDEGGSNGTRPRWWKYNLWEWGDDMTYVRGTHTFKWGGSIRRVQNNMNVQTDTRAAYAFETPENLLLAQPHEWSGTLPGQTGYKGLRNTMYGVYFQDDWQVNPRLTLNLGLRWEWITDPTEANNRISNLLDINHNENQLGLHPDWRVERTSGYPGYPDNIGPDLYAFTEMGRKNVQPRFGFAWQLDDSASRVLRGGVGVYHDLILPSYYTQSLSKYPPFYSRARIRNEDVLANTFPLTSRVVTGDAVRLRTEPLLPHMDQPTKYSYTLALQQQLGARGVVEIAYVGSQQRHLERYFQLNSPIPELLSNGVVYRPSRSGGSEVCLPAPYGGWDGVSSLARRCPSTSTTGIRRNPNWDRVRQRADDANANYNGLQVRFSRQTVAGALFQANYTYSKVMNQQGGLNSSDNGTRDPGTSQDPFNLTRDWGRAAFDSTHVFTSTGTLPLPFQFESGAANAILGGWTVSGVFTALAGQPFTPDMGFDWSRQGNSGGSERPDVNPNYTGNVLNPIIGSPDQWFDPNAFALPNPLGLAVPQPGFFGNIGRNTMIGPRLISLDFTLTKRFQMGEEKDLTFRAEFFNLLNRPNLGLPEADVFDPDAAGDGITRYLPHAGRIPGDELTTTARQIQFGLKFTF